MLWFPLCKIQKRNFKEQLRLCGGFIYPVFIKIFCNAFYILTEINVNLTFFFLLLSPAAYIMHQVGNTV